MIRRFATETTQKLRLTLTLPHQTLYKETSVEQVNLSSTVGDVGILGNHVPTVFQLRPGVIKVNSGSDSKSFFGRIFVILASGGFATVHPDSSLTIQAIEAVPLEHLDKSKVLDGLAESASRLQAAKTDFEKAEAQIAKDVFDAMKFALEK